jgi:hypothetical protein
MGEFTEWVKKIRNLNRIKGVVRGVIKEWTHPHTSIVTLVMTPLCVESLEQRIDRFDIERSHPTPSQSVRCLPFEVGLA